MRRSGEKGLALLTFAMALMVMVPLLGLGVDSAMLYITKERLNAAVQLSLRSAQRSANPEQAAQRFFNANFPKGFLGIDERTVTYKDGRLHASVKAPTYFMRAFRYSSVVVEASAGIAN